MRNKLGRLETSILDRLVTHGYEAMVVGGAVRDWLIARPFSDIDIATNAPYDKLAEIMEGLGKLKFAGKQFGVLLVGGVEVATYRSEVCKDNNVVELNRASNAVEDSRRRDFTVNAIYYDYAVDRIWDFHGGSFDVQNEIIKAVGNPHERFNEDYSRILRAMYLSATLDFGIESKTGNAIIELGHNIKQVPNALVGKIVRKAIKDGCFHKFLYNLVNYHLLEYVFPEMVHTVDLEQNSMYHKHAVWNHTLAVVKSAETKYKGNISFVMGAFLHDIAKGLEGVRATNRLGEPNDLGHEEAGVPIAKKICKRLELGKTVTNEVAMYVGWHGTRMATSEKSVRHFLFKFKDLFRNSIELYNNFNRLLDFIDCDADGFNDDFGRGIKQSVEAIREVSERVFHDQAFYSHQFKFNTSVIAKHPKVKPNEIKQWIEFFIRQNILEEEAVVKILDKQVA